MHASLAAAVEDESFWANFYFSIKVYVRAKDGTIKEGNMNPGVAARVVPVGSAGLWTCPDGDPGTSPQGGGIVLRCSHEGT